jgi:3',5'-cyclic AMP phosphodiesterase CpdA
MATLGSRPVVESTMPERILYTIVHLTDLHFGRLDPDTGGAPLDSSTPLWYALNRRFRGYLGHHYAALLHFHSWYGRVAEQSEPGRLALLITGDLTCAGHREEFELAKDYFQRRSNFFHSEFAETELSLGLEGLDLGVPGNHDHWPGSRSIFGSNAAQLASMFPATPRKLDDVRIDDRVRLALWGVDSSSGVRSFSPDRLLARGRLLREIERLRSQLGPPVREEIRVLLCHHSWTYRNPDDRWGTMEMDEASRNALSQLVQQCGFRVLLSGHHHEAFASDVAVTDGARSWDVAERRGGTGFVFDHVPPHWSGAVAAAVTAGGTDPLEPNVFFVHQIVDVGDSFSWRTQMYHRYSRGFRIEESWTAPEVRIWP